VGKFEWCELFTSSMMFFRHSLKHYQVYLKSVEPSIFLFPASAWRFARINNGEVINVRTAARSVNAPVAITPGR
jgi:hypothetical protein